MMLSPVHATERYFQTAAFAVIKYLSRVSAHGQTHKQHLIHAVPLQIEFSFYSYGKKLWLLYPFISWKKLLIRFSRQIFFTCHHPKPQREDVNEEHRNCVLEFHTDFVLCSES